MRLTLLFYTKHLEKSSFRRLGGYRATRSLSPLLKSILQLAAKGSTSEVELGVCNGPGYFSHDVQGGAPQPLPSSGGPAAIARGPARHCLAARP